MITGKDLIAAGYKPGPHFKEMLEIAKGITDIKSVKDKLDIIYKEFTQTIPLKQDNKYQIFIDEGRNEFEIDNVNKVKETMNEVVKTPTVIDAMVMPDACPAGNIGTIPVGGIVFAEKCNPPWNA